MQSLQEIKKWIDQSVLCWLATSSEDGEPNVSPKEVFTLYQDKFILVANIASPNTVRNIKCNPKVCISFIDIFVQKGMQIKGEAEIVDGSAKDYSKMEISLLALTKERFPFRSITKIEIQKTKPIIAPSYLLFPETTEKEQINSALHTYRVKK